MNAKMPELKAAFEDAGFTDVATVIASGNVVFRARSSSAAALEKRAEKAMEARLGRSFLTIVRATDELEKLLAADAYASFDLPAESKRVVTFLKEPAQARLALPLERDGASILLATPTEVYSAYVPSPQGASFMKVIEDAYGADQTTRTWGTIQKCVKKLLEGGR